MELTPQEVHNQLNQNPGTVCYIDVRSLDEFESGHIPGARCLPLDQLERELHSLPKDRSIILGCQSGRRSRRAVEILKNSGFEKLAELSGGFLAWRAAGLPVNARRKAIPIQRQVMVVAGFLILLGTLLGFLIHPGFFFLSGLVGLGLFQAGITGWCGMARLLERMPWNRVVA